MLNGTLGMGGGVLLANIMLGLNIHQKTVSCNSCFRSFVMNLANSSQYLLVENIEWQ